MLKEKRLSAARRIILNADLAFYARVIDSIGPPAASS